MKYITSFKILVLFQKLFVVMPVRQEWILKQSVKNWLYYAWLVWLLILINITVFKAILNGVIFVVIFRTNPAKKRTKSWVKNKYLYCFFACFMPFLNYQTA